MGFLRKINKYFSKPLLIGFLLLINISYLTSLSDRIENIENRFGGEEKLKCSEEDVKSLMQSSVVRIIGGLAEGSGFPISEFELITSFHVIDGEASPKVVFPDGSFETPTNIIGNREKDIAILTIERELTPLPFYGHYATDPTFGEPVYSAGYPFGSELPGDVTINKGSYGGKRYAKEFGMTMIQTDISVNRGMSGGPLVNSCGQVIGVNTAGVAGLSMFLDMASVRSSYSELSVDEVTTFEIDTETPEGVVNAFYTYISARDLQKAYELISEEKLNGDSLEEWKEGYSNTLHSRLLRQKADEEDENKINIKLESQDWVDGELVIRYYEGYWIVNNELKLNQSQINTIEDPDLFWFYEWDEE